MLMMYANHRYQRSILYDRLLLHIHDRSRLITERWKFMRLNPHKSGGKCWKDSGPRFSSIQMRTLGNSGGSSEFYWLIRVGQAMKGPDSPKSSLKSVLNLGPYFKSQRSELVNFPSLYVWKREREKFFSIGVDRILNQWERFVLKIDNEDNSKPYSVKCFAWYESN